MNSPRQPIAFAFVPLAFALVACGTAGTGGTSDRGDDTTKATKTGTSARTDTVGTATNETVALTPRAPEPPVFTCLPSSVAAPVETPSRARFEPVPRVTLPADLTCAAWAARYGARRVTVTWTNVRGEAQSQVVATRATPLAADGCALTADSARFTVERVGEVTGALHLVSVELARDAASATPDAASAPTWSLRALTSNCEALAPEGLMASYARGGYALTDDLRARLRANALEALCPAHDAALARDILAVLGASAP